MRNTSDRLRQFERTVAAVLTWTMGLVRLAPDLFWYLLLTVVFPLVALCMIGIYYLLQSGDLLIYIFIWTLVVVCVVLARIILHKRKQADAVSQSQSAKLPRLTAKEEWTPIDLQAWSVAKEFIDAELSAKPNWNTLKEIAIEQHAKLANIYFPGKTNGYLSFTLPELLLVLEETSSRYRAFITKNIPFADSVQLASINTLYQHRVKAEKGYKLLSIAIRLMRLSNPVSAATSEVRDHVSGKVLSQAGERMQFELKRTLLEELAQVGIDLYSGRLRIKDTDLASYVSSAAVEDKKRLAISVEPMRIVLMGQSNAGKSSLINALTETGNAEVDLLQTTDSLIAHASNLIGSVDINFLDTPGYDGRPKNTSLLLQQAISADVILWISKATQPGRANDVAMLATINDFFAASPVRIPPPMLLVVTHIDRLRPVSDWSPPYDLANPVSAKAQNILAAVKAIETLLPAEFEGPSIEVALNPDNSVYNIDEIIKRLGLLSTSAHHVQLNRRRLELADKKTTLAARFRQSKNLVQVTSKKLSKQWLKNRK